MDATICQKERIKSFAIKNLQTALIGDMLYTKMRTAQSHIIDKGKPAERQRHKATGPKGESLWQPVAER
jgi:hypothetical protein